MNEKSSMNLNFTGERFIPGTDDYKLSMEHIQRYRCVKKLIAEKTVLDAACGEGYGCSILAESARKVIGIDISEETIRHAVIKYADKDNLFFYQGNIAHLSNIETGSIDVVISFETIEHVNAETQRKFLKEIQRVLRRDGLLIMSTPNQRVYSDMFQYKNEFHVHEFTLETFQRFLKSRFKNIKLLSQSFEINCVITDGGDDREAVEFLEENRCAIDTCKYFIAIASNGELPKNNLKSVFVGNYGEYNKQLLRINELQDGEEKRNQHIAKQDKELHEKGEYIFSLQKELENKDSIWKSRIDESHDSLKIVSRQLINQINELQKRNDYLQNSEQNTKNDFEQKKREMIKKEELYNAKINELIANLSSKENLISEQYSNLQEKETEIENYKEKLSLNALQIEEIIQKLTEASAKQQEYESEISCKLTELKRLNEVVEELNAWINTAKAERESLLIEKEEQRIAYENVKVKIGQLTGIYEDKIKELNQIINNKDGHIAQLLEKEREFQRIQSQRSYKVGEKIHTISNFLFPGGSTRRFVAGTLIKVIRHPIKMARFLNPHRIRKFFWLYKMGGMDSVQYRFRVLEANELTERSEEIIQKYAIATIDEMGKELDYENIIFDTFDYPEVSIIIPVFNQFQYTYQCLKSIKEHTKGIAYEVIIGDDNSTDLTKNIAEIVKNILVVKNVNDQGFLYNCNNAAEKARGKYILFLNNDTQVQEGWLKFLLELLKSNDEVGMVGSKLIYANGTLQEAGGIVWQDGSAWNYGNGKNPEDPEFNYVKEVDYISGACIMIRSELWQILGGFDTYFAPAYYEDTDLAFRVREQGYKVLYQPKSEVIHFEGISNGTDTGSGMKANQLINEQKFCRRWKRLLETEHFPNGNNVFLAKDRSKNKKHILVIDHYVPHFDNDAGGRCTYMWLKLFVKLGLKVTFLGDNFYKHEPYTTVLNQLGIEVLYGNFYYENWKEWLKENLHYFDYIYLQRPHISIKYIDIVKKFANGKVFYFAHDLHFLRLTREYELTRDKKIKLQAEDIKKKECYLFEQADVVHVVGSYEQKLLSDMYPEKPIRNIPLYIYETLPSDIQKDFSQRKDLIFVGGFGHPPNTDAVLWFAKDVYPKIRKKYPDIKWHIVGGKVPEEIIKLQSEHIIVHGFVSDENLERLYRECRLAVVPLRYGAGVKGKVIEAAYYQIPLVTTTIGGEGIPHENCFAIEDDAERMAELIIELYNDFGKLEAMSESGKYLIQNNYTLDAARNVFLQDIERK